MLTGAGPKGFKARSVATPQRKGRPMRRIMTGLAIIWLVSLGVMATMQLSRNSASAAAFSIMRGAKP